jgi:hypothetical protein
MLMTMTTLMLPCTNAPSIGPEAVSRNCEDYFPVHLDATRIVPQGVDI